ncbi:uncharacterized protein LOC107223499 isoform X2 [Neodiprion lecontei]|uniref:Uncharacterized protein LOC107223499 isoform X2 n=1 Tax=Neodiprion lecontei TaxID=441921 RepID=A0ABM3GMS9_NEOLC|nr:uncharacterized protein LOC107223499 isoform X2 [Neodiprion lecontei]
MRQFPIALRLYVHGVRKLLLVACLRTSTDLVPQLLGMFDEIVRRGTSSCNNHAVLQSTCGIPVALQKRLSLVSRSSRRGSLLNPLYVTDSGSLMSTTSSSSCSVGGLQNEDNKNHQQNLNHHHHQHHHRNNNSHNREAMDSAKETTTTTSPTEKDSSRVEITLTDNGDDDENTKSVSNDRLEVNDEEKSLDNRRGSDNVVNGSNGTTHQLHDYPRNSTNSASYSNNSNAKTTQSGNNGGPSPLRYNNRRCRSGNNTNGGSRPLSGSSIASSTSSSGCSNQGIASAVNPYLASVESLADTCASSQGSADSGVVTVSESICRGEETGVTNSNLQRRDSAERPPSTYNNQPRPRYSDPHRNPVERVLLEIVDTEAVYVEHLRQVIQGYLIFWRDDPLSLVDQVQLCDLFSNIEDIYEFNSEFLKEIKNCGLDPVCVANTFIKHNSGFEVYTEYCTNYPRTVAVLTDLMGQERTANAFRERQAALGHALPLGSFLLKPVQRILKYHLLLQNLSKECDADVEENELTISAIEGALAAMTGIARHINVMKRKHEHAVRVQEIQSLLYGWPGPDLTTSGELVAEGRFRMRGAKAPRHAFLFDRMLLLTKKKEDGLLVYKAHIVCSNLMLIESIPGEALSFHVIPFDNPRLQYTLQARNLEQKREWTMQIKRVILENYNAVIPSHARQLVMQLGQTQPEDEGTADKGSAKKQHSAPPEYLEKRKQERERRKPETGLRNKLRKSGRKTEPNVSAIEVSTAIWHNVILPQLDTCNNLSSSNLWVKDMPSTLSKNQSTESITSNGRDQSLNRSADGRSLKVKDRFASWRRKSEPGFQSYVSLNRSDEEEKDSETCTEETLVDPEPYELPDDVEIAEEATQLLNNSNNSSAPPPLPSNAPATTITKDKNKDNQEQQAQQTMEEIVGHILMQNRDFQKLLEKQRTSSIINMRQQQRFNKHMLSVDTSDSETENDTANNNNNNNNHRGTRSMRLTRREQRLVRANNARNSTSPPPREDHHTSLQLRYDNLRVENDHESDLSASSVKNCTNRISEKRAIFEAFKKQSIVTESKVIQTALRIRENSTVETEREDVKKEPIYETIPGEDEIRKPDEEEEDDAATKGAKSNDESKGFGNYDNLQRVWEGVRQQDEEIDGGDSPTRPAVWLTKLCEGLPTTTQKSGSLPRSFQINPHDNPSYPQVTKSRFLQRDGKPMSERPFTIASDKPAEINLEDMERYVSSCQPEGRIAKFPTSTSTSTFFYSLDEDSFTDAYSEIQSSTSASANVHPDHKIYRASLSTGTLLKNVFSKKGSILHGLRSTESIETLGCSDEAERVRQFGTIGSNKVKKKSKSKSSRESSSDVDEMMSGCVAGGNNGSSSKSALKVPSVYYKQGSSGLGARIAQSDYADPTLLFGDSIMKRTASVGDGLEFKMELSEDKNGDKFILEHRENEADSFYEKSFETIENYVNPETEEVFRDSAIFSDMDEAISAKTAQPTSAIIYKKIPPAVPKIAPPIPVKRKPEISTPPKVFAKVEKSEGKVKPAVARKPNYLKVKSVFQSELENTVQKSLRKTTGTLNRSNVELDETINSQEKQIEGDDVSAGQSRAGWVRKIVGQLQGQDDA